MSAFDKMVAAASNKAALYSSNGTGKKIAGEGTFYTALVNAEVADNRAGTSKRVALTYKVLDVIEGDPTDLGRELTEYISANSNEDIINRKCGLPVFIAEFAYPSGKMDGPFAGWSKKAGNYEMNQQGQADVYKDVIVWGRKHGLAGIRYWAPDFEGWYAMALFDFSNKVGTAKTLLSTHKEILESTK